MIEFRSALPVAVCDWCLAPVKKGLALWREDGRIAFVHEGCLVNFKEWNKETWTIMGLDVVFLTLFRGSR